MLLSTLRLSLRFVPANHRQLNLPSTAWNSLEKVVVYKAASGNEQNSCKPTDLCLELVPSQYRTSSVIGGGPITEDEGILNVQDSSGISQINHPGRYYTPADWAWYIPWFRDYSTCGILEVFNQGDRYPDDRKLWDNINENLFVFTIH